VRRFAYMMVINGMITHVMDCYHIIAIYVNTVSISKQDIFIL
jgi:hypothetical protein